MTARCSLTTDRFHQWISLYIYRCTDSWCWKTVYKIKIISRGLDSFMTHCGGSVWFGSIHLGSFHSRRVLWRWDRCRACPVYFASLSEWPRCLRCLSDDIWPHFHRLPFNRWSIEATEHLYVVRTWTNRCLIRSLPSFFDKFHIVGDFALRIAQDRHLGQRKGNDCSASFVTMCSRWLSLWCRVCGFRYNQVEFLGHFIRVLH